MDEASVRLMSLHVTTLAYNYEILTQIIRIKSFQFYTLKKINYIKTLLYAKS